MSNAPTEKRISMLCVSVCFVLRLLATCSYNTGPGKHLQGLTLLDGVVQPEEFDYFRAYRSISESPFWLTFR